MRKKFSINEPDKYARQYNDILSHSFVTSWLHSFRYKHILSVVQEFALENPERKINIVEVGSADSKLYALLNDHFNIDYTGVELNEDFVKIANENHGHNPNFKVISGPAQEHIHQIHNVDIVIALECLEHIPEGIVVRIVESIAKAKPSLFVCSVPVEVGPAIWLKNIGSAATGYLRHKEYTWNETFWAGLYQLNKLPPHETGHKGFDWRWLAQTIRHNMNIKEMRKFPLNFMPAAFSTSVFFISTPRK